MGQASRPPSACPNFSGSQAPAWEPHCRQSSCFARESSIYGAMRPKQELGEIYVPKQELGNEGI